MINHVYALYHAEHEGFLKVRIDSFGDACVIGWEMCDYVDDSLFSNGEGFFKTQVLNMLLLFSFLIKCGLTVDEHMFLVPCIDNEFDFGLSIKIVDWEKKGY